MSKYYKLPVKRILNLQELREKSIIMSYYIEGFCALFIVFFGVNYSFSVKTVCMHVR